MPHRRMLNVSIENFRAQRVNLFSQRLQFRSSFRVPACSPLFRVRRLIATFSRDSRSRRIRLEQFHSVSFGRRAGRRERSTDASSLILHRADGDQRQRSAFRTTRLSKNTLLGVVLRSGEVFEMEFQWNNAKTAYRS